LSSIHRIAPRFIRATLAHPYKNERKGLCP
jgi:hypothetical protein